MHASSPQVYESRVIKAPIDKVWDSLRSLDFKFWKLVEKVEIENDNHSAVGNSRTVQFKDGMTQVFKVVEISDLSHSVAYEVIGSDPAISVMSALHHIKATKITHDNTTFVEWSSEFSTDADQQVVQDSRYKKVDGLKDLAEFIA